MSDILHRAFDFNVSRADSDDDGLTLEGYAAVFDMPTEINSWEGAFTETISRGAFTKTLSERAPILQFDHGTHPLIGSIPLGVIRTAKEDEQGLFIRARLSDNWLIQPVREAIRDGGITGMSFQFEVLRDQWSKDRSERNVQEVKLYEVGPVVWPAYADTSVGVRSIRSQISGALAKENFLKEFANVITFPDIFADSDAADTGTSDEADDTPPEPEAPVVDRKAVTRALRTAAMVMRPSPYLLEDQ